MKLEYSTITFEDIEAKPRFAEKLRGYLGNKYDNDILHNHKEDKYLYRYPLVQYKVIKSRLMAVGINEGSKLVLNVILNEDNIIIDDERVNTFKKSSSKNIVNFGIVDDYMGYKFETPWIALNQKNIEVYSKSSNLEREELLKKVLIGNIISMSKGLNYTVDKQLYAWINLNEVEVKLKGIRHKAFLGEFKVNFNMPNYIGIGKSVSRGFGTIKSLDK